MAFDPVALLRAIDPSQLTALAHVMVLAADADGDMSEVEIEHLGARLQSLAAGTPHASTLAGLPHLLDSAHRQLRAGGRAELIAGIKSQLADADARKAALGLAISVTAADGIVRTSERELILELAEELEVDRDAAADLVRDITRMLSRSSPDGSS
jgi:uncharacterized tellurite resistance protein B-like protein